MSFFQHAHTFGRIQFGRHLRSPALWIVALAAPIMARFMIPRPEANYAVMSINDARPVLSSAVIGLEIGIISALFLSPFAYIFLRAGPTKTVPWQVEDICPKSRNALMVGNWLADTAVLWLVLFFLAVAGVIISFFRLPLSEISPLETCLAAMIVAGPALAFVAGLRTFFSARPRLRKAGGDILFFMVWLGGIMMASAYFIPGGTPLAIADLFGFAASLSPAIDVPIQSMVMPGVGVSQTIEVDALRGVLDTDFLWSRLFWIGISFALVLLSGLVFKPRTHTAKQKSLRGHKLATALSEIADKTITYIGPKSSPRFSALWENFRQILTPKSYIFILGVAAAVGAYLDFTPYGGAVIWLALLFPLVRHSARWQSRNLTRFTSTLPPQNTVQLTWQYGAGLLLSLVVCLPAIIKAVLKTPLGLSPDMVFIVIGLPLVIVLMGALTRSAVLARILLLLVWYVYLNL